MSRPLFFSEPDPVAGAPWGAIVDGYQLCDRTWHRIDRPEDIDLDDLVASLGVELSPEDAAQLWRDSIGEMGAVSYE